MNFVKNIKPIWTSRLETKMKQKFQVGETVLAGDKGNYYEAKVLKLESLGNIFKYFIHYQGWDRKHDSWLDENNIEPFDNASKLLTSKTSNKVRKNAALKADEPTSDGDNSKNQSAAFDKSAASSKSTTEASSNRDSSSQCPQPQSMDTLQANKKRKKELATTDLIEDDDEKKYKLTFNIPCDLKRHLVDEWVIITQEKNKRLLKLPCKNTSTVRSIIDAFLEEKKVKLDKAQFKWTKELMLSLLRYFDVSLPRILLYRQERGQYDIISKSSEPFLPSAVYGGEHLLRLFVRLPRLLSLVYLQPEDTQNIHTRLSELLKFLHKHSIEYVNIHHYAAENDSFDVSSSPTKKSKATR